MSDEELDRIFSEMGEIEFPEFKPEDLELPEIEIDKEYLAECEAAAAAIEARTRRWVESDFKLGGHLPPLERRLFDAWRLRTLKAASVDPSAASQVEKLTDWVAHNHDNIRKYRTWKTLSVRRSKAGRFAALMGPMLIHFPLSVEHPAAPPSK